MLTAELPSFRIAAIAAALDCHVGQRALPLAVQAECLIVRLFAGAYVQFPGSHSTPCCVPLPFMEPFRPLSTTEAFAYVIMSLCKAIGVRLQVRTEWSAVIEMVHWRLRRLGRRFEILVGQIRTGTLPPSRVRPPRKRAPDPGEDTGQPPPKPRKPRLTLPSGFGWLISAVPYEAAGCASQLRHLLTTNEEMKALVAATPRMIRLLRPLCHMLGIDPDLNLPVIPGSAASRRRPIARLWEHGPIVGSWRARRWERGELRTNGRVPRPPPWARVPKPA